MTNKFNPKIFKNKKRIYTAVPRAPRISRLWVWNEEGREYTVPSEGNIYYAARYEESLSGRKRVYSSFASLEEARLWQISNAKIQVSAMSAKAVPEATGSELLFREVIADWKRRRFPLLGPGTQLQYEKLLRLHFRDLEGLPVRSITPACLDKWLDDLRVAVGVSKKRLTRVSFRHELDLLSTLLRFYQNYYDDGSFQYPIKERHKEASQLKRSRTCPPKDLSESEFLSFLTELGKGRYGERLVVLATIQYFQAHRISETAGLYWEDIYFDWETPRNSRIRVVRSVCYPHKGQTEAFIKAGFKNGEANEGMKEQPMFPEVYEVLKNFYTEGASGLIFHLEGKPIPYRVIQSHYDRAFKRANLPYRGTHVMRHGGCRRVLNEGGDLQIAQQHLGNTNYNTTLIYAKRQASALTKVVHGYWEKKSSLLANACNESSDS